MQLSGVVDLSLLLGHEEVLVLGECAQLLKLLLLPLNKYLHVSQRIVLGPPAGDPVFVRVDDVVETVLQMIKP